MPPRRNGKHWEQLLQKTDIEFLLSGKKGDRPVEARLVDFVWRSRQSLGRGLAIFHRSRFDAAPPAAFPAKSAAATLLIFSFTLALSGRGRIVLAYLSPVFEELQLMNVFFCSTSPWWGVPTPAVVPSATSCAWPASCWWNTWSLSTRTPMPPGCPVSLISRPEICSYWFPLAPSKETQRQPPVPRVRQVLRERGQPEEAPGLPPRDDQPARLQFAHVALLRLHRSLHARKW